MSKKTTTMRGRSHKILLTSLTLGAVLAVTRPAVPTKVYATGNLLEWTKQDDLDLLGGDYVSAASSASGGHLISAVTWGGEDQGETSPLFISSDYGVTWEDVSEAADNDERNYWSSVDVSSSGQKMVAASDMSTVLDEFEPTDGKIFISEDAGDTWDEITPPVEDGDGSWRQVAIAGNGSKIVAISNDNDEEIYISNNGGDSWVTEELDDMNWIESVSISDNGNKILVGGENDNDLDPLVYISDDGGNSWDDITPIDGDDSTTVKVAMSSNGNKLATAIYGWSYDVVYVSGNGGANWTDVTPEDEGANDWSAIAMSGDGSKLSVLDPGDRMLVSSDNGTNWTEEDPDAADEGENDWVSADFNANGLRMIVASEDYAYTSSIGSTVNLADAEGGKVIKLTTPEGTTITCYSSVKESTQSAQDAGYMYPLGLVDFCFDTTDESNEVTLVFVTDLKPDQVVARKYNPTTETYSNVSGVSITETTHEGQHALQVTYTIVDNGPLDLDPDDGEIADPVGLANALGAPNTGVNTVRDFLFK